MSFLSPAQAGITTTVRGVWTDLHKFYEDMVAERQNWRQLMEEFAQSSGMRGLGPKYAVAMWTPMTESETFGFDGLSFEGECHLYYITRTLDGSGIQRKAAEVKTEITDAIEAVIPPLLALSGDVSVLGHSIDVGPMNVANATFLESQVNLAAGMVAVRFLAGS